MIKVLIQIYADVFSLLYSLMDCKETVHCTTLVKTRWLKTFSE